MILSDGLEEIGAEAFDGCVHLTSLLLPVSVTEIEPSAFSGCLHLTLFVPQNSFALNYARAFDISYSEI